MPIICRYYLSRYLHIVEDFEHGNIEEEARCSLLTGITQPDHPDPGNLM